MAINGSAERSSGATLFDGINSVRQGTVLKFCCNREQATEVRYYSPVDDIDRDRFREYDKLNARQIVDEFDRLLTDSVRKMLVSDAALGSFVSGGVDSALISAIAKKEAGEVNLFTADVVGKYSEFEDARTLSSHISSKLYDCKFDPQQMLSDWASTTYHYESPIIVHTNAIPFASVAQLARSTGVKGVLTGEGGDELFLGYPRLLTRRYESLVGLPLTILKQCYGVLPGLREYVFGSEKGSAVDFATQVMLGFEESSKSSTANGHLDFIDSRWRAEHGITIRLLGEKLSALLHRNDRMGMMASIEARFPYLDEDIIKFGINLPSRFKIGRSPRWHNYKHPFLIDKWIIRALAERYLPRSIVSKKKNGFPMYGHKNLRLKPNFFKNGWVEEMFKFDTSAQDFMLKSQDPYHVAKLASIEVFGRLFGMRQTIDDVQGHIMATSQLNVTEPVQRSNKMPA